MGRWIFVNQQLLLTEDTTELQVSTAYSEISSLFAKKQRTEKPLLLSVSVSPAYFSRHYSRLSRVVHGPPGEHLRLAAVARCFPGRMPFLSSNQQCQSNEGSNWLSLGRAHTSAKADDLPNKQTPSNIHPSMQTTARPCPHPAVTVILP